MLFKNNINNMHFVDAAMISNVYNYGDTRRRESTYAVVEIVSCQHDNWWYHNFIGEQVMVELRHSICPYKKIRYIRDCVCVYLTKTKVRIGRGIDPKDIIIL